MRVSASWPEHSCKIALVGEAPGEQEERAGAPFVGLSGQELRRMLQMAGINPSECLLTNVFSTRPAGNRVEEFCTAKKNLPSSYNLPPLSESHYVKEEHLHELARLKEELTRFNPNIVVCLGNTACWAILRTTKISSLRGTITEGRLVPFKVLPTYHPAAILRDWSLRTISILDFVKAKRESAFPAIHVPHREIILYPTLEEMEDYWHDTLKHSDLMSVDIETAHRQFITCIGFAASSQSAIVIPFVDYRKPGYAWWEPKDEIKAWKWCRRALESGIPILGQNFLYDIQYLHRHGIRPKMPLHDTMILHHSKYPEMPKSLAFMGSVYTNEQAWKLLRPRGSKAEKDEE